MIKTRRKKTDRQKQEALLDNLWSEYIRKRAMKLSGGCQRCPNGQKQIYTELQAAHLFSRKDHTTRWDTRAGCGLCGGCHRYIDSHAEAKIDLAIQLLGLEEYENLYILSSMTTKQSPVDLKLTEVILRQLLKELE